MDRTLWRFAPSTPPNHHLVNWLPSEGKTAMRSSKPPIPLGGVAASRADTYGDCMNKTARRVVLGVAATAAAAATGFQFQRWFSEQPEYEVLRQASGLEVRRYPPRVVATTTVAGGENDGFRILAGYIFGGNGQNQEIAMTSPVVSDLTRRDGAG